MKFIESGVSIGIIVFGAFLVSIFGSFSLSEELEWYIEQGFPVSEQEYSTLSQLLSPYTIDVRLTNKVGLREQALYVNKLYGQVVIYYDTNDKLVYIVAHKIKSNQKAMVFVWKTSIG